MTSGGLNPLRGQESRARAMASRAHAAAGSPLDVVPVAPGWSDKVTAAGLVAAVGSGLAAACGRRWSAGLWVLASAADVVDGALARRGGGGPHGGFLDSCADRIADASVCAGVVARELASGRRLGAGLAAGAGLAGAMPSYVSAAGRAEGLRPGNAGPGRMIRSVGWALVLTVPSTTSGVCSALVVGSLFAAARRYVSAIESGASGGGADTGPSTPFDEDAT